MVDAGVIDSDTAASDRSNASATRLQRAVGTVRVAVKQSGAETVLDELYQSGCLRARFPRRQVPGWMDVVTLNTSGGIAGGDELDLAFRVASGAQVVIAAQAAERFYRRVAGGGPSVVRTAVSVAPGAAAEWLPQETILFDGSGLDRRLEVSLAGDARFLGVETLVFGRAAMGERVRAAEVADLFRICRDGVPILHDSIRLGPDVEAAMRRKAMANGGRALATVAYVGPDTEERLTAVRDALPPEAEAAASAWNGMLIARIIASDGAALRRMVTAALSVLRNGRPLPRVWMC